MFLIKSWKHDSSSAEASLEHCQTPMIEHFWGKKSFYFGKNYSSYIFYRVRNIHLMHIAVEYNVWSINKEIRAASEQRKKKNIITTIVTSLNKLVPLSRANLYLFKVNSENTRKRYEICLKWTITTQEWRWVVGMEHFAFDTLSFWVYIVFVCFIV